MTAREAAHRYEQALAADLRRSGGVFYTPAHLVERLLDLTLEPLLAEADDPLSLRILDPACGAGLFLAAAAERIATRAGVAAEAAYGCLIGVDIDADAVALARGLLPGADVRVGDGLLLADLAGSVDCVVGNPPFLNQLRRATTSAREEVARLREVLGGVVSAYTDVSAVFLARSLQYVRVGGRVGLVQPLSLLAARDAAGVRDFVESHARLDSIEASPEPQFPDASVLTCLVSAVRGEPSRRRHPTWGPLVAEAFGIPAVALTEDVGVLDDLGAVTADFRDQYYGLREHLTDGGDGFPLITTGLIEPGRAEWGSRPARVFKQAWQRPTVAPTVLDGPLGDWARSRLVPKVLIGTQGRIIEAVVDAEGGWLPGVPVITMTTDRPWHALAVLCAPPVVAHAAAAYVGTGLSGRSIKLSARQVAALPLPSDPAAWDQGARLAEAGDLLACARVMTAAYGEAESVLAWWRERAGLRLLLDL